MWNIATLRKLNCRSIPAVVTTVGGCLVLCSLAFAAQDKYSLKIPDGLSWSDFRGYENWQDVAVSQTETRIKAILANPVMMQAFRSGLPAQGKLFPDGSKVTKIEWSFKKNPVSPYSVDVPDALVDIAFIEKDTKRFPDTHGWAYAEWAYEPATDTFKPAELSPSGHECGFSCHTRVSAQDYIFTAYPKR
jgi:Cytochrome P460